MDEFRKSDVARAIPDFGGFLAQAGSDATRRFCEQGQSVAKTFGEWNAELNQFLTHRIARNSESLSRMTKCGNFQEACAIQVGWMQDAVEDYLKQLSKLIEVNGSILSRAQEAVVQAAAQPETPRSSTARVPVRMPS